MLGLTVSKEGLVRFINDSLNAPFLSPSFAETRKGNKTSTNPKSYGYFKSHFKVAVCRSVIFGAYTTFVSLLGMGSATLTIPAIAEHIINQPLLFAVGGSITFLASFFSKLASELHIRNNHNT